MTVYERRAGRIARATAALAGIEPLRVIGRVLPRPGPAEQAARRRQERLTGPAAGS